MEELQCCSQIAAEGDRGMVHQWQHIRGMENGRTELPALDPWETSVATPRLLFRKD